MMGEVVGYKFCVVLGRCWVFLGFGVFVFVMRRVKVILFSFFSFFNFRKFVLF